MGLAIVTGACVPICCSVTRRAAVNESILELIARMIEWCEPTRDDGPGHPPTETVRVLATLRRFLREGTPWRSLRATDASASGFTLRRRLADWARTGVLRHVHSMLVGMLRSQPDLARDLIVDSCSARAKRSGDLTGPNPTDRAKKGTKYHVAVNGDGLPVACAATAATLPDTVAFERLFRAAFVVMARVRTAFADKGYDAEAHRDLRRSYGTEPRLHKRGQSHGSRLGKRRWPVERANAWLLENKRLGLRYDRLGFIVESLLQAARILMVAPRLAREF